jgi:hypothetical protein
MELICTNDNAVRRFVLMEKLNVSDSMMTKTISDTKASDGAREFKAATLRVWSGENMEKVKVITRSDVELIHFEGAQYSPYRGKDCEIVANESWSMTMQLDS